MKRESKRSNWLNGDMLTQHVLGYNNQDASSCAGANPFTNHPNCYTHSCLLYNAFGQKKNL